MLALLAVGFVTGMRHALEADHLAAVVAMSTRSRSPLATVMRGAAWGAGHTVSLLVLGGICLAAGATIPDAQAHWFERAVGVMLILVGVHVLMRLRRDRIHVHLHRHGAGRAHVHAHRREGGQEHQHPAAGHLRAAVVGMVHGAAGTAAILLLTAVSAGSFWWGLAHIGTFGLGSILGMASLSAVIAVPLELTSRRLTRTFGVLEATVAVGTMILGATMVSWS